MQENNNNFYDQNSSNNDTNDIEVETPIETNIETDSKIDTPTDTHSDSESNETSENEASSVQPSESSYSNNTIFQPEHSASSDSASKGKSVPVIIALIAAATIVLIGALFCATMLFIAYTTPSANEVNMQNENMTVIKNSPQISISENTDVNYVPQSIPEVVKKVADSVVEISTSSVVKDGFFQEYVTGGAGSGVIITQSDEAGYLLTNYHVIEGVTEIIVRLTNGEEYAAQCLGGDEDADLAVLRIIKKNNEAFTAAPLGNSNNLLVGQEVIAIGNPLGSLGGTVTNGILSALDRTIKIDGVSMVLLQHNAAINPGNSGGGLFDAMGNLIGIVNAKTNKSGIEGLGFAIPINVAYNFFNRIVVIEPSMGIKVAYGSVNRVEGLYVIEKQSNSKFELYDRILSINGHEITSEAEYYYMLSEINKGSTATIKVKRGYSTVDISISFK